MISLILPTYRNPKFLDICLKSATENICYAETEIIVVVDGYLEESREILNKYKGIGILEFPDNRGMQFALNAGVSQANNPYVFIINDDNILPTKWDARLIQEYQKAIVTSNMENIVLSIDQVEPIGPSMFNFVIHDLGQTIDSFDYQSWLKYEVSIALDKIIFDGHIFPFLVSKKHYMAVGGFDTFYNSPNICDWDHFLKYELLEFQFPRTRNMHLYHFGSVSTKKNEEAANFKERELRAMGEFQWKWGVSPYNGMNNTKIPPNNRLRGIFK